MKYRIKKEWTSWAVSGPVEYEEDYRYFPQVWKESRFFPDRWADLVGGHGCSSEARAREVIESHKESQIGKPTEYIEVT